MRKLLLRSGLFLIAIIFVALISPTGTLAAALQTAIGPIDVSNPTEFVRAILNIAIGVGGGIAILLILYGAFLVTTSGAQPDKVQAGKELISSAIMGLLLIIFSVFVLQLIGKDILDIPGFGG